MTFWEVLTAFKKTGGRHCHARGNVVYGGIFTVVGQVEWLRCNTLKTYISIIAGCCVYLTNVYPLYLIPVLVTYVSWHQASGVCPVHAGLGEACAFQQVGYLVFRSSHAGCTENVPLSPLLWVCYCYYIWNSILESTKSTQPLAWMDAVILHFTLYVCFCFELASYPSIPN